MVPFNSWESSDKLGGRSLEKPPKLIYFYTHFSELCFEVRAALQFEAQGGV